MGTLGLGQGFHPVGDFVEAFVAGVLRHARVHVSVLVGLACHRRLQVVFSWAYGRAGGRTTHFFQAFELLVGVTSLTFCGSAGPGRDIVVAFYIGLQGEIKLTALSL